MKKLRVFAMLLIGAAAGALSAQETSPPLDGVGAPRWYEASRMHVHTRLSPNRRATFEDAFRSAGKVLESVGAQVLIRHVRSSDEPPLWASTSAAQDALDTILADAPSHVVAYFWHSSDRELAKQHPDWVCHTRTGRIARHKRRGDYLDLTGPYGAVVAQRLITLQRLGFNGAYLDGRHMPPAGCFGTALEESMPPGRVGQVRSEQAKRLAQVVSSWRTAIADPDFALIISVATLPTFLNPEMTSDLARSGIPKTELSTMLRSGPDLRIFEKYPELIPTRPTRNTRLAAGLNFLRSLSGASPHVWIHGISDERDFLYAAGQVITHGGIANLDIAEADIEALLRARADNGPVPEIPVLTALTLNSAVSDAFVDARSPDFVALHISESARAGRSLYEAWQKGVGPSLFAFERLQDAGLPVRIIDDRYLSQGNLAPFRFILSAEEVDLSETMPGGATVLHLPDLPLDPVAAQELFETTLAPVLQSREVASVALAPLPDGTDAQVWQAPAGQTGLPRYVVSAVMEESNGPGPARTLRLQASATQRASYCIRDVLTPVGITEFSGAMALSQTSPWQVFEIAPCSFLQDRHPE